MSSFRASPWVSYEPNTSYSNRQQLRTTSEMDGDVDMEAPQISTLREEATPPPASMKSKPGWLKPHGWSKGPNGPPLQSGKSPHSPFTRDDQDEPEEEEDQLIDDDDGGLQSSTISSSRLTENVPNRKSPPKKKARKGNKTAVDAEEKSKEKVPDPLGAQNLAPTMSCFKATPAESHEDAETASIPQIKAPNDTTLVKAKKKVSPRKPPTIPRAKTKLAKYVYLRNLALSSHADHNGQAKNRNPAYPS
jgi:Wiskott-Aldrich syndrome protein